MSNNKRAKLKKNISIDNKSINNNSKLIVLLFLASIFGFYGFISTHQVQAANFADDILRPIIGSQGTIAIESIYFKMQDGLNQLKYSFIKPRFDRLNTGSLKNEKQFKFNKDAKFNLTPIKPLANLPTLKDEGIWKSITNIATSDATMAETFFRPDPSRKYSLTYLVKMNMSLLNLFSVAGIREPGEQANPGPGKIPTDFQNTNSLIAAFNGGFQKKDGHYGMIVGNKTYLPLQNNLATLVIYKNSPPKIIEYEGQNLGKDVIAVRQNGPLLIKDSRDVTFSTAWNMQNWGLTTTNSMYTWRSGIGITKNGNLVYAVGPSLVPQTLAKSLQAAGAINAMQLDINPVWVRFVFFKSLGNGKYDYYPLISSMVNGGHQFLFGYQKDFFYLLKK